MSRRYEGRARSRERSRERSATYRNYHSDRSEAERAVEWAAVPPSKHTICIKGLSKDIKSYQVEDYLKQKIGGPLDTVFFKPGVGEKANVLAIRFDDKEKAKICVDTLHKTLMFGSRIYIDFYKDLNRHRQHLEMIQQRDNKDDDRRAPRGRSRERNPLGRRNYSISPMRNNNTHNDGRRRTPEKSYANEGYNKQEKSDKDSKNNTTNQSKRSPLLPMPSSTNPVLHYNAAPIPSNNVVTQPPPPHQFPFLAPYPIDKPQANQNVSHLPPAPINLPPGFFSALQIPKEQVQQQQQSKFSSTNFPTNRYSPPPLNNNGNNQPMNNINNANDRFNSTRVQVAAESLKYQPEIRKEPPQQGRLRLGAVSAQKSKDELRNEKMARLDERALAKVDAKFDDITKDYQSDCTSYGYITQLLINKDPDLEQRLRVALNEVLKDLNNDYMDKFDEYINLFINT